MHQGSDAIALLSLCAALALPGCKAAPDAAGYGEAVGLEMEGSATLPAFRVSYRARPPADPHALVSAVAGLTHQAMKSCPAFAVRRGAPAAFAVNLEGGHARARSLMGEADGRGCFAAAMDGRAAEGSADLLVQVEVP